MTILTVESAQELLHAHMQNQNLRRHCYSVGIVLKSYYDFFVKDGRKMDGLTSDDWEIAGILHDSDYEETKFNTDRHTLVLLEWLKDYEVKPEILDTFKTHNTKVTNLHEPETLLEWTLECCDELTGFIVAVALVMPNKKLSEVTVEAILKKFKQKDFAKAVDRNQITQCEEKLYVGVEKFVEIALIAMRNNSDLLGL
jgi:uncharacterized protein